MSLLYFGLFVWLLSALFDFEFSLPVQDRRCLADLWHCLGLRFKQRDGIDFLASLGKAIGIVWMLTGILTENILNIELGSLAVILVYFIPPLIGAAAWKSNPIA